ncbi:YeeE/YedE family protein [Anderseniella sp. Alg231-50]|uniref:YeeE/YedE family protein n=1 Tax=Anderseniella sp. Alg231-50 TaxID=1922226 RepID=UPI00307CC05F
MDLSWLIENFSDAGSATIGGGAIGFVFGIAAQRSRFCLRSATIEFWRGSLGPRTAVWLLAFGAALLGVQLLFSADILDAASVRQLSTTGSLSGAVIGGLMFGSGMILARGCASRLLVLSATGNLRALITGLILTVVAQASLRGVLSPARLELASLWLVGPEARNLMDHVPHNSGLAAGLVILALAAGMVLHHRLATSLITTSLTVGIAVTAGWWFTATLAGQSFDIVPVQSVSFTGPSTDTLMAVVNQPNLPLGFGLGLVPGVFAGSFVASCLSGEFHIQTFNEHAPMPRYIAGASLMGFGSMLAGGCAVGAGMTGGAVLALTAWIALVCMWLGAGVTDLVADRRPGQLATG